MKLRTVAVAALCIGLVCGIAGTQAYAQGAQITVYNPMGTPPPIQMKAMAPRLDTLDGKTIYLVDTGFPNSDLFFAAVRDWFRDNRPKTNTVIVNSGMSAVPEPVLNEIREKADAVFFGLGH
jgi:hypothetical protein